jgi:hypothetical protein
MANHGTVFASRHKLARERVEAMKVIWTASKAAVLILRLGWTCAAAS